MTDKPEITDSKPNRIDPWNPAWHDWKEIPVPVSDDVRVTIGRHPSCDVVVDDPHVSLVHASLTMNNGMLLLRDEGSVNGTYVAGHRVWDELALLPDDRVTIGRIGYSVDALLKLVRSRRIGG